MESFYALTSKSDCLQILYKFCKNWISVPNIVHQLTLSLRYKYCKIHSRSNFQDAMNSIRRLAAEPMTSVIYDVIRLESVRGRSNMLIEGHFWRFLGNFNPKMFSAIVWTPKRHIFTSQRVFWTIMREIPCPGYFSRRVRGKNKNKKERPYISRISPGAPLRPIGTNFGLHVRIMDLINCAKFYHNRLKGLDSVRGRSLTVPIGLRCRR